MFKFLFSPHYFLQLGHDQSVDIKFFAILLLIQVLDHVDDILKDLRSVFLDIAQKVPQFLIFRPGNHKLIALLEIAVELPGQFGMGENGFAHF